MACQQKTEPVVKNVKSDVIINKSEPKVLEIKNAPIKKEKALNQVKTESTPQKNRKKPEPATKKKPEAKKSTSKPKPPTKKKTPPPPAPPKKMPEITFDNLSYDFGEITEGDKISHKFTFKNTGNAPLTVTKANATCGCTQPSFPFIDINPGETGYIGVDYYSVNKDGPQSPEITVYTNTSKDSTTLTLVGIVNAKAGDEDSTKVVKGPF